MSCLPADSYCSRFDSSRGRVAALPSCDSNDPCDQHDTTYHLLVEQKRLTKKLRHVSKEMDIVAAELLELIARQESSSSSSSSFSSSSSSLSSSSSSLPSSSCSDLTAACDEMITRFNEVGSGVDQCRLALMKAMVWITGLSRESLSGGHTLMGKVLMRCVNGGSKATHPVLE